MSKYIWIAKTAGLLAVLAAACLIATPADAVVRSWDAGGDGTTWFDAINWSGNSVPGVNDTAALLTAQTAPVVYTGINTTIQQIQATQPISLDANTLNLTNNLLSNSTLTLNGGSIDATNGYQFLGSPTLVGAGAQPHLELINGSITGGTLTMNYSILTIDDTWANPGDNNLEIFMRGFASTLNGSLAPNHVLQIEGTPVNTTSWGELLWKSGFENNGTILMTTSGTNPNGAVMVVQNDGHVINNNLIDVRNGTGGLRVIEGTNRITNSTGGEIKVGNNVFLTMSGVNEGSTNNPNWNHLTYEAAGGKISDRAYLIHTEVDVSAAAPAGTPQKINLVGFDNRLVSDNLADYTLNIFGAGIPVGSVSQAVGAEAFSHSVLTLYNDDDNDATAKTFTNSGKIVLDAGHVTSVSNALTVGSSNLDIGSNVAHTFVNAADIEVKTGVPNTVQGTDQPSFRQIRGIGTFRNEGLIAIDADTYLIIEGINKGTVQNQNWDHITYDAAGGRISGDAYLSHAEVMTSGTPSTDQTINLIGFDTRLISDIAAGYSLRVLGSRIPDDDNPDPTDPEPDAFAHAVLKLYNTAAPDTAKTFTNSGKIILDSADIDPRTPRKAENETDIATANVEIDWHRLINEGDIEVKVGAGSLRAIRGDVNQTTSVQGVFEHRGAITVEAGTQLSISGTQILPAPADPNAPRWRPLKYIGAGGTIGGDGDVLLMHTDIEFTADEPASESVMNLVTFDNRLQGTAIAANNTLRILGTEIVPDFPAPEPADAFGHALLTLTSSTLTNSGKIILDSEDLDPSALNARGIATATLDVGVNTFINEGQIEARLGAGNLRTVRGTTTPLGTDQGVLEHRGQIVVETGAQLFISGTQIDPEPTDPDDPRWRPLKYIGAGGTISGGGDVLFMHTDIEFTADTPATESVMNLVTFDNRLFGSVIAANNTLRILGTEIPGDPEAPDAFSHALLTVESPSITNNGKIIFDSQDLDPATEPGADGVGSANLDIGNNTFINAGEILVRDSTGSLRELRGQQNGEFRHEGTITVEDGALFKIAGTDLNAENSNPPSFSRVQFVANGGSASGQVFLAHSDIHINAPPTSGELVLSIGTFDNHLRTDNLNGSTLRIVGTDLPPDNLSVEAELPDQLGNAVLNMLSATGTTSNRGKIVMTSMDLDDSFTRGIGAALIDIGRSTNIQNPGYNDNYIFINESDGVIEAEPGPVSDNPVPGARSARIIQGKGTLTNRGLIYAKTNAILRITGINDNVGSGDAPDWVPLTYRAEGAGTTNGNVFLTHTKADVSATVTGGGQRVTSFATPDNVVMGDNPANSTLRVVGTELLLEVNPPAVAVEPPDAMGHAELFFMQQNTLNAGNIVLDAQDLDPASNVSGEIGSANLNLDQQGNANQGNGQNRTFTNEGVIEALATGVNSTGPSLREVRGSGKLINRGMIKTTDPADTGLYLTVSGINVGQQGAPNWKPLQFQVEDGGTTSGEVFLVQSQISVADNLSGPSIHKLVGNANKLMTNNNANSTLIVQGAGNDPFGQGLFPNAFGNAALTFKEDLPVVRNFGTIVLTDGNVGSELSILGSAAIDLVENRQLINETSGVIRADPGILETARRILGNDPDTTSLVNKGQIIAPSQTDQFLLIQVDTTGEGGSFSGNINFDRDLELDNGSSVQLQIGGPTPQAGHDEVNVTENITLGGELSLGLAGSFRPDYGDTFDILTYDGQRTGTFDTVSGGIVDNNLALASIYDFVDQSGTRKGVTIVATGPGDVNLDFEVNIFDISIIVGNINQAGTWTDGDINGDGNVDVFDISIVLGNINRNFTPPSSSPLASPTPSVVPEPGTFSLLGSVLIAIMARPRRSRRRSSPSCCV